MDNPGCTEHSVIETRIANSGLFELVLGRKNLEFTPGDCVAIHAASGKSRPYSIASGSGEEELRFVIRAIAGGAVSPWLMSRNPGDTIQLSPPFGWFRPGQEIRDAPFVFIATGTGIAPFLSYRCTGGKPPVACLYGVRRKSDAIGYSNLRNWCPTRLAISREKTGTHHQGHVSGLLDSLPDNPETHYFCCGLESMVKEVGGRLQERGVPFMNIHREVFFHG